MTKKTKKHDAPSAGELSADGTAPKTVVPKTVMEGAGVEDTAKNEVGADTTNSTGDGVDADTISQTDDVSEDTTQGEEAEIKGVDIEIIPIYNINVDTTIVVCGDEDAIKLLEKAWNRVAAPANIVAMRVDADTPFHYLIGSILAWDRVPDNFVFVPANCFPTHNVTLGDLITPRVRVLTDGTQTPLARLPMLLESDIILKTLEVLLTEKDITEEMFFEAYNELAYHRVLIDQVTMSSGNTVGYVTHSSPNIDRVKEALACKKFICCNAEGFRAIQDLLVNLYGE